MVLKNVSHKVNLATSRKPLEHVYSLLSVFRRRGATVEQSAGARDYDHADDQHPMSEVGEAGSAPGGGRKKGRNSHLAVIFDEDESDAIEDEAFVHRIITTNRFPLVNIYFSA